MRVYPQHPQLYYKPSQEVPAGQFADQYLPIQRTPQTQQNFYMLQSSVTPKNNFESQAQELRKIKSNHRQIIENQLFNSMVLPKKVSFNQEPSMQKQLREINQDIQTYNRPQSHVQQAKQHYRPEQKQVLRQNSQERDFQQTQYSQTEQKTHQPTRPYQNPVVYQQQIKKNENPIQYYIPQTEKNQPRNKVAYQQGPELRMSQMVPPHQQQDHRNIEGRERVLSFRNPFVKEPYSKERTQSRQEYSIQQTQTQVDKIKIQNTYQAPIPVDERVYQNSQSNFYVQDDKIYARQSPPSQQQQYSKLNKSNNNHQDNRSKQTNSLLGDHSAVSYKEERDQIMSQLMNKTEIDRIRQQYQQLRS